MRPFALILASLTLVLAHHATAAPQTFTYGSDKRQNLDVYPATGVNAKSDLPVVVWVHGGGWRHGDKDNPTGSNLCKTWSAAGIVMVNLNYRLTPDVVHPAHVQDVAAGIAWVHKNIAAHGGNPRKVFLLGHSAGAHLVALVATDPQYLKAHGLTPATALAGVMPIDTASFDLNSTRSPLVRDMIKDAFGADRIKLEEASPLVHARRKYGTYPPFVIAAVKQRPEAVGESEAFRKALPKAEFILMDYPRCGQLMAHGMIARDLFDLDNKMTKQLLAFVRGAEPGKPKGGRTASSGGTL